MTAEECLDIFREEIREHLHWQDAQEYLALLESNQKWKICDEMGALKTSGRIPATPRFVKAFDAYCSLAR